MVTRSTDATIDCNINYEHSLLKFNEVYPEWVVYRDVHVPGCKEAVLATMLNDTKEKKRNKKVAQRVVIRKDIFVFLDKLTSRDKKKLTIV